MAGTTGPATADTVDQTTRRWEPAMNRIRIDPIVWASLLLAGALTAPGSVSKAQEMIRSGPAAPTTPGALQGLPRTGAALYRAACANCHGGNGAGTAQSQVGFALPLPDFSDCNFATREPNTDWAAVVTHGGPARGFSVIMPAFGTALTAEQIESVLDHIRTFCDDSRWPRGELNLPRAMVTEKAYPEDEAVFTLSVNTEGTDEVGAEVVYEQRFGPRSQLELVIPFAWEEQPVADAGPGDGPEGSTRWASGIGDVAVGVKHTLYANLGRGMIWSVTGEAILPTGDQYRGFGKGTVIFEPFVSYGQILPARFFLHGQAGFELPTDTGRATEEAFGRLALGRSFRQGRWGRLWAPMVELLGARELESGATTSWDALPQIHVTLSDRQHVRLDVGVRIPLNDTDVREPTAMVFVLWDWFDGGLFEGW